VRRLTLSRAVALAVAGAAVFGCAGSSPRLYINPDADMSYYKKVAVLPLSNLSADRFAGDRVTRMLITELTIADRFQIVEPADFWVVLERIGGTPGVQGVYDPKKLQEAAKEVGVTGIIRGSVNDYQMIRSGSGSSEYPVLAFDVELWDVATGNIAWRISLSKRGKRGLPLMGGSARTYGDLTERACREAVARLEKEAF
jgi:hypothetical protein